MSTPTVYPLSTYMADGTGFERREKRRAEREMEIKGEGRGGGVSGSTVPLVWLGFFHFCKPGRSLNVPFTLNGHSGAGVSCLPFLVCRFLSAVSCLPTDRHTRTSTREPATRAPVHQSREPGAVQGRARHARQGAVESGQKWQKPAAVLTDPCYYSTAAGF